MVGMTTAAIVAATVVHVALRRMCRMYVRRGDESKTVDCCCSCRLCRVKVPFVFAAARLLRDESRSIPARLMRSFPELDSRAACPEKLSRFEALGLQECPCWLLIMLAGDDFVVATGSEWSSRRVERTEGRTGRRMAASVDAATLKRTLDLEQLCFRPC